MVHLYLSGTRVVAGRTQSRYASPDQADQNVASWNPIMKCARSSLLSARLDDCLSSLRR